MNQELENYQLKYIVPKRTIKIFRFGSLLFLLSLLIFDFAIIGLRFAFSILKFFTCWGFMMAIIYFAYISMKQVKYKPCVETNHIFQIICTCHFLIFVIFWLILMPTNSVPNKHWDQILNNIILHFVVQGLLVVEFFINNRVFTYNKVTFFSVVFILLTYTLVNYILAKSFEIYPYKLIKWQNIGQSVLGFSIFIFGICSYFILIKANSLKLKKVTDDTYLNADEEIV